MLSGTYDISQRNRISSCDFRWTLSSKLVDTWTAKISFVVEQSTVCNVITQLDLACDVEYLSDLASASWKKLFRLEQICAPALRKILEGSYPNQVVTLPVADQLSYHSHRLERYFRVEPCGQTVIQCAKGFDSLQTQLDRDCITARDERIAYINSTRKNVFVTQINVQSLIDGKILRVRPSVPVGLMNITLSSTIVAACTIAM